MSRPGNLWRSIHGHITHRPTNFSWVLPDVLAGSGIPTTKNEFEWMLNQGVKSVVTMTEEPLPEAWVRDIHYKHSPTPDMAAPTPEVIDKTVDFIHNNISVGRPVMVHCAAGLGRAGTILACYLIKYKGRDAQQAIADIRKKRPGSIQSTIQEVIISLYEKRIR
ncbi:MAG: protein tyrosine phosphatase [Cenarchaeum sp. SB0677_bin_16]|nr:protein tyrosine phosphatase [Cenarchaeum sp. SB0677_bin_16]